jgi:hypothetical protein
MLDFPPGGVPYARFDLPQQSAPNEGVRRKARPSNGRRKEL